MEKLEVELLHPDTAAAFGKEVGDTVHIYPEHAKALLASERVKKVDNAAEGRKDKTDKAARGINTK